MEINGVDLQSKIDNGEKVIVEMYAEWCGPCKMLKPTFEKVANENTTDVQMYTMDIEENRDFVIKYGVRSIPTIKTFNMGQVSTTKVGVISETQIKELVNELINE